MFFAPKDVYPACGVYTTGHLISTLICFLSVAFFVFLFRRTKLERVYFAIRVLAVVLTALESVKIFHNFYWGYTNIDSWVPLSFCSLFIYACYLSGYGRGRLRSFGNSFIVIGGIVGGFVFVCMPTTSLTMYPIFHFQSLYSLLFHSLMMTAGVLLLKNGIRPTRKLFNYYVIFFGVFAAVALIINSTLGSNLMTLREPYKLPIDFLHVLQKEMPAAYTALGVVAHIVLPFCVMRVVDKIYFGTKDRRRYKKITAEL